MKDCENCEWYREAEDLATTKSYIRCTAPADILIHKGCIDQEKQMKTIIKIVKEKEDKMIIKILKKEFASLPLWLISIIVGMAITGTVYKLPRIAGIGYGATLLWVVEFFFFGYLIWRDFDKKKGLSFCDSLFRRKSNDD